MFNSSNNTFKLDCSYNQFIMIFLMINITIYFIPLSKSLNFEFNKKTFINWKW